MTIDMDLHDAFLGFLDRCETAVKKEVMEQAKRAYLKNPRMHTLAVGFTAPEFFNSTRDIPDNLNAAMLRAEKLQLMYLRLGAEGLDNIPWFVDQLKEVYKTVGMYFCPFDGGAA